MFGFLSWDRVTPLSGCLQSEASVTAVGAADSRDTEEKVSKDRENTISAL